MISVSVAAINIFWFSSMVFAWCFDVYLDTPMFLWILAAPVLTIIGVVTGGIAFYKNRFILGLALNLPPLLLSLLILIYFLSPDGRPPK